MAILRYWSGWPRFPRFFTAWSYAVCFKKIFFMPVSYLSILFLLCFNLWSWSFGIDKFSLTDNSVRIFDASHTLPPLHNVQGKRLRCKVCPRETTSLRPCAVSQTLTVSLPRPSFHPVPFTAEQHFVVSARRNVWRTSPEVFSSKAT